MCLTPREKSPKFAIVLNRRGRQHARGVPPLRSTRSWLRWSRAAKTVRAGPRPMAGSPRGRVSPFPDCQRAGLDTEEKIGDNSPVRYRRERILIRASKGRAPTTVNSSVGRTREYLTGREIEK